MARMVVIFLRFHWTATHLCSYVRSCWMVQICLIIASTWMHTSTSSTIQSRHTFLLLKEVNWEVHSSSYGTMDTKENALVWSHMFGHLAQHNLKRNGWRVHVLLYSKLQLCLIFVIAFLVFKVFRAHLHQAKGIEETIHKEIWNATQNKVITYSPGFCQQLKHSTLSHCPQSDCLQYGLLPFEQMQQQISFSTHSNGSSESKIFKE